MGRREKIRYHSTDTWVFLFETSFRLQDYEDYQYELFTATDVPIPYRAFFVYVQRPEQTLLRLEPLGNSSKERFVDRFPIPPTDHEYSARSAFAVDAAAWAQDPSLLRRLVPACVQLMVHYLSTGKNVIVRGREGTFREIKSLSNTYYRPSLIREKFTSFLRRQRRRLKKRYFIYYPFLISHLALKELPPILAQEGPFSIRLIEEFRPPESPYLILCEDLPISRFTGGLIVTQPAVHEPSSAVLNSLEKQLFSTLMDFFETERQKFQEFSEAVEEALAILKRLIILLPEA